MMAWWSAVSAAAAAAARTAACTGQRAKDFLEQVAHDRHTRFDNEIDETLSEKVRNRTCDPLRTTEDKNRWFE